MKRADRLPVDFLGVTISIHRGPTGLHASVLEGTSVFLYWPIGAQDPQGSFIGPLDPA